jgi:hypothetical protein
MTLFPKLMRDAVRRRLAKSLLPMATLRARFVLRRSAPRRVLVDTSVLGHGVTHETGWISTGTGMWGNIEVPTGYLAQIPVHAPQNAGRLYNEVQYLASIAHLGRTGHLKLCSSAELGAERFRQPVGRFIGYSWADHSVFKDISMESVDGFHLDLADPKETQLERVAACTDPLYRSLLEVLGEKLSLDAYHIYTAERHGLFCFLHIDFALADRVSKSSTKAPFTELRTRVLLPSELARLFGVLPVATNLLTLADDDTSFPVRADLHSEKQQRQRQRKPT